MAQLEKDAESTEWRAGKLDQPHSTSNDSRRCTREGFGTLYSDHAPAIHGYLRALLPREHDVEEVRQEVFVKAFHALPSYRASGPTPRPWLKAIAYNTAMSYLKDSARARPAPDDEIGLWRESAARRRSQCGPAWGSTSRVHAALEALPRLQRDVLTLRYLGGLSPAEVGDVLSRTDTGVRQIECRGLQALRALLSITDVVLPSTSIMATVA